MGTSFTTHSYVSPLTISLQLFAAHPTDQGSIMVYLAPDTGTSGTIGVPSYPTIENPVGTFTNMNTAQLVGSIADSALTSTPALYSLTVTPTISTSNEVYWVVLYDPNASSSIQWSYESNASGIGATNQYSFQNVNGTSPVPVADSTIGAYQMIVTDAPEPTALSVLGVGLVVTGLARRRSRKAA
ncbi:MAG: hypothetical protein B7Z80_02495 [Rhodospirillales bacterium 20-64-7]|nr:MAG: hypothetical protein B7Z80_02495 [Rhodospirillales bacterium 20-64-7]